MTKKHSIKKALLTSIMSLILCFAMLTGTTFAWFTDQETSANNKIIAGNLDVELYYQAEGQSDWTNVTESTNVFKENSLWEPGHTEVVKLKIVNEGSLALKYTLGVNVAGEVGSVNVNDNAFKLSDFIKYAIIDGAQPYTRDQAIAAVDATATTLKTAYNSDVTALEAKNDGNTDEKIVTMVVYMPTTVGNDANAKTGAAVPTIKLGINLFATQMTAESDSFDNQYDKDAEFPVEVKTADELATALKAGGLVKLANDTIVSESLPITKDTVLDLNGKKIGTSGSTTGCPIYLKGGKLTIKNGTLDLDGSETNVHGTFATAIGYDAQTELVVENVTFTGQTAINGTFATNGPLTITVSNSTINTTNVGIAVAGESTEAIATINNCNINAGKYAIFASQGAKITINGGTYKSAENVISSMYEGSVVTVNGGYFEGNLLITANGALVIKGGTFNVNPSAYVATGYQAVDNGDGTWTVGLYKVSTATELADAIANGKTAVSLSNNIALNTQLEVNGELTIYGNGNTITAPANGTRVVNVIDNTEDVTVTLVGAKLDAADKERGISFYNNSGDLDVTIIDCEITAKYYGVNVAGQNAKATLNIKDSTLKGYCAFQTFSPNTVATFDNCVLEGVNMGYNNNQYPTANNFATVVVNSLANNSTLTFNNCTVIATEKDSATAPAGQWPATQAHIIDHATGTTINWNNCTFIKNGKEVSAPEPIN